MRNRYKLTYFRSSSKASVPFLAKVFAQGLKDRGEEGRVSVIPGKYYLFIKLIFEYKYSIFISQINLPGITVRIKPDSTAILFWRRVSFTYIKYKYHPYKNKIIYLQIKKICTHQTKESLTFSSSFLNSIHVTCYIV